MADEMQDPKVPEQPGEPTPEEGFSRNLPEPAKGEEGGGPEEPMKRSAGGLLRRLTGSLRRVTGSLGKTGPLGDTGMLTEPGRAAPGPEEPEAVQPPPAREEAMRRDTGLLGDPGLLMDTGMLPDLGEAALEGAPSSGEPPAPKAEEPGMFEPPAVRSAKDIREDALRRDTGLLGGTDSLVETGMLPDLSPNEPEPSAPQPPQELPREDLLRRETGLLGDSGPLVDTGLLPAPEPVEPEVFEPPAAAALTLEEIPEPKLPGEELLLRRESGLLGDSGPLGDSGVLPLIEPEEAEMPQPAALEAPGEESPIARDTAILPELAQESGTAILPELRQEDEPVFAPPEEENLPAFDWMTGIREEARQSDGDELNYAEIWEAPQPVDEESVPLEEMERRVTGSLVESSEISEGETIELPGPVEPLEPPDWMAEIRGETEESEQLQTLVEDTESAPAALPPEEQPPSELPAERTVGPSSPLKRVTDALRRIVTGALRRPTDELELSDDELSGRLERSLTPSQKQGTKDKPGRKTGSLLRRVTGSLRRTTGSLGDTGSLPGGPRDETRQEAPFHEEMPRRVTGPLRETGDLRDSQVLYAPGPVEQPEALDWMAEIRGEVEEPAAEKSQPAAEKSQPAAEAAVPTTQEAEEAAILGALRGEEVEAPQPESLGEPPALEPPAEPFYEQPPQPQSPLQRVTGALRRIVTGALRRQTPEQPEISDDLLSGRLERSLTQSQKPPAGKEKTGRITGNLVRRVTGSLRRVTGSLRDTGSLPGGAPPVEPVQAPPAPFKAPEPSQAEIKPEDIWGTAQTDDRLEVFDSGGLTLEEPLVLPEEPAEQPGPADGDAITLLASGAIAAMEQAEQREAEPDWMRSIREETAREGAEAPDEDQETGLGRVTGSLRKFVSGVRGAEETRRREAEVEPQPFEEPEAEEDIFAGRFDQVAEPGLGLLDETEQPGAEVETPPAWRYSDIDTSAETDEDAAFLDGLEARFGQFDDLEAAEAQIDEFTAQADEENPFDFLSGTSTNIWGEVDHAAPEETLPGFTVPPTWDQAPEAPFESDLARQLWGEAAEVPPVLPVEPAAPEEAAGTGEAMEAEIDEFGFPVGYAELQQDRLEHSPPFVDIRSIALEDYEDDQEWIEASRRAREEAAQAAAAQGLIEEKALEAEVEETVAAAEARAAAAADARAAEEAQYLSEPTWDFKTWLASHSKTEKMILYEAALVVLAVLIAVPFFIFMIMRGPAIPQDQQFAPRALPADMPAPTGLMLPGGWSFALEKSTVADGLWKPVTSEWLEGTELRRVVALPWNEQTEAVIQTFQPGDLMQIRLSNGTIVDYKVESVERVPINDTSIYSDLSPSLVIILYEQTATERWVVIGKP